MLYAMTPDSHGARRIGTDAVATARPDIIDRTGSYRIAIATAFAVAMVAYALLIPLSRYEPVSESPLASG